MENKKVWDVFKDKIISNDIQYEVVLIVAGIILEEYASPKAKELYKTLTSIEIAEIKRKLKNN